MQIIIFTDNKQIEKFFSNIKNKKKYTSHFYPISEFKKTLKNIDKGVFFYIDISSMDEIQYTRTLNYIAKQEGLQYGLIDPKGAIEDIADIFHKGASDYISKSLFKKGISLKRLEQGVNFKRDESLELEDKDEIIPFNYIPSGNEWNQIESGQEYTFCFMFIELDNQNEIKKILSGEGFNNFSKDFRNHIEKIFTSINGKIWIWTDFGGLLLFPFNGKKCDAIYKCFRLVLYRSVMSVEDFTYNIDFSFRIVLHIGNTIYKKRGDTGNIISDSINSIFHIGQRFAKKGNFYMTSNVYNYIPKGLGNCFLPAGDFEDKELYRMRLPVFG